MLKKEKRSIVISLGDDGAIVGCYSGDRLLKRLFVTSHLSSDFVEVTQQYPDATIYFLLDTIDQNYVFSSIPDVGRGSIKKIVKRKLENEFDANDLNSYVFLGKEKTGPKTTLKYLFISVRNSNPFKDWAEAISNLPHRFGGVYLVPVEAQEFITKLRLVTHKETKTEPDEWEILVSYNRVGGFRQVVLKQGKLIFTRISQSVSLQTPNAVGKSISQETANTLEYIRRIGFYDQSISVYIISSKESYNFIDVPGVKAKDIYHYSPFELSVKMGLEQSAQESDKFGDVLFATNFIGNPKKVLKVLTPLVAKAERLETFSKILSVICLFIIGVCLLGSAYMFFTGHSKMGEIEKLNQTAAQKSQELASMQSFEKEYGLDPENVQSMVKFFHNYSQLDKKYIDMIVVYRGADKFSDYIKQVEVTGGDKEAIIFTVVFDPSSDKNYSDVLSKFEQFKVAITTAFKDKKVEFTGLPSESDIKVDFESSEGAKKTDVTVTISDNEGGLVQ